MITKMTVENFKALRHVEVDLAPLTVLIGPNNSGKTSFLEAVYALSQSTRRPLASCFWSPWQSRELVYENDPTSLVRLAADLIIPSGHNNGPNDGSESISFSLALNFASGRGCTAFEQRVARPTAPGIEFPTWKDSPSSMLDVERTNRGTSYKGQQEIRSILKVLNPAILARWDVEELGTPSRLPRPKDRAYPFDASGYGLASCIAEMKLDNRKGEFDALRRDFCTEFPEFQDIIVKPDIVPGFDRDLHFQKVHDSKGEGYALFLLRTDGVEIPAGSASGGILVMLAFFTLIHLPEPRKLLLIEEPENALHPGRLREVIAMLRRAMAANPDSQVIITTHSPLLLDCVEPEEVRVFIREEDDVKVFNVADVPDIRDRLKYLMLGELVYNEGEQELVKEIQHHAHIPAQ